jgi:PAS domain-containing protein
MTKAASEEDHKRVAELAGALTALKANTAELLQRKKQLQQLNRWFDIALNNMARGLSMFDADQRLIVCNKLYREFYDLPQRLTRPGTPLAKIVRYHAKQETGRDSPEEIERQCEWIHQHVAKLAQGRPSRIRSSSRADASRRSPINRSQAAAGRYSGRHHRATQGRTENHG